jgi:hypothetical protein
MIPVNVLVLRTPWPGPEVGTDRVRNRDQRGLRHLLIRDPEHCSSVAFVGQATVGSSAGLETCQARQQDGDQPVSVGVDPGGALGVSAGEQADLGGVHIGQ